MNKIDSVSPISSAATKEGQGRMQQTAAADNSRPVTAGPSSKVELTGMAHAMMQAQKVVDDTPDIDEQRVAEIKAAISNGSYQIDADRIAAALVDTDKQL
jgi:negative regulator of flagellin synthesis FlgM